MTYIEGFPQIPDYRTINAAHIQAEGQGVVSVNRLPVGSVPLEEAFACMDREGAIVPVEPPVVGRKSNGFDGRGRTHRVDLITTSPHTVLRESAGLKDSTSQELTVAKSSDGESLTLLDVLRAQPYARGIGTRPTQEELIAAEASLYEDSRTRKTNRKTDWD